MTEVETCNSQDEWDNEVIERGGHPLQLWGWGEVKAAHGWTAERIFIREQQKIIGMAQLLIKRLPGPFKALVYVPRGPVAVAKNRGAVLAEIAAYAKRQGAVAVTVEPDWEEMPLGEGWVESFNTILIPRTLILNLGKSEDELLADMTKKTRQYIRKSAKEVAIRRVKDAKELEACLRLYHETAKRAGFELHDDDYYRDIFGKMGDFSPVFAAFDDDMPVAFLWLAISGETAFELYGGMNDRGQVLRANYALKWEAIRTMKKWGIRRYDFNGLLNDGVSTFKQGFSDQETMLAGTYDYGLSPLYVVWNKGLPLAKKILRRLKR